MTPLRALGTALALLLLLLACGGEPPLPPAPGPPKKPFIIPPPSDEAERSSLVNLGSGSTVVARSGESVLEVSAIGAIDGDPGTSWQNPPKDFPQSLVVALPARARIDKVGVRTASKGSLTASKVTFELSTDGRAFRPLVTMEPKDSDQPQWLAVAPADALFLRVTVPVASQAGGDVRLMSILAHGRELEPPRPGRIDGCWDINGRAAAFRSQGAHATGTMTYAHGTMTLDGGSNGRLVRMEWIKGAEYGYAAFTVAPDRQHLNGIQWHEEVIPRFFGDAWFGTPAPCGAAVASADVAHAFLQRTGRHSLYALRFRDDDTLDAAASAEGVASLVRLLGGNPEARLVAHEFRESTAEANRARAQRMLDSLRQQLQNDRIELRRVTFVAAGSDQPRQIPGSEAARELYSTIDLEVGR